MIAVRVSMLLLCASLAACTTVGNGQMKTLGQEQAAQWLQPGKTTQAEAERVLGRGSALRFERSGWETWSYVYKEGLPKFLDFVPVVGLVTGRIKTGSKELVLLFDDKGLLRKYALQEFRPGLQLVAAP